MIALLTCLMTAVAQEAVVPQMDAQTYRLPVDARRTLWTDEAWIGPVGWSNVSVLTQYSRGALAAYDEDGLLGFGLRDALSLDLVAAVHLKYVRIGVDLPVYALTTSDFAACGAGLGDAAVDLKLAPIEGLAFVTRFALPTSTLDMPLGSPGLAYEATVVASKDFDNGHTTVAGNLGYRGLPEGDLADQIVLRAGIGQKIEPPAGISFDVAMRMDTSSGFAGAASPVEALFGGWGRLDSGLVIRGGVGAGITNGMGSPQFRTLLVIGYQPDLDTDPS